jgi:hypothetical protein
MLDRPLIHNTVFFSAGKHEHNFSGLNGHCFNMTWEYQGILERHLINRIINFNWPHFQLHLLQFSSLTITSLEH